MARILLAEDDDNMRSFLVAALQRAGHSVEAARDGAEAVGVLAKRSFDLLVADVVMPGIDGVELARRASRDHPGLKVMFITGFAAVALRGRSGVQGRARVLSKPFHLKDLVREVDQLLCS